MMCKPCIGQVPLIFVNGLVYTGIVSGSEFESLEILDFVPLDFSSRAVRAPGQEKLVLCYCEVRLRGLKVNVSQLFLTVTSEFAKKGSEPSTYLKRCTRDFFQPASCTTVD